MAESGEQGGCQVADVLLEQVARGEAEGLRLHSIGWEAWSGLLGSRQAFEEVVVDLQVHGHVEPQLFELGTSGIQGRRAGTSYGVVSLGSVHEPFGAAVVVAYQVGHLV